MIEKLSNELIRNIEREILKKEIFTERDYYHIATVKIGKYSSCLVPFSVFKRYIYETREIKEIEKEIITKVSLEECANVLNSDDYTCNENIEYFIENNNIYKKEIVFVGYKIQNKE